MSSINDESKDEKHTMMELDSEASKEQIELALKNTDVIEIVYNGGLYIIKVNNQDFTEVLGTLLANGIPITYVRDISKSSRRLFV